MSVQNNPSEIKDMNQALNVIISAIDVAQSRGAFKLEEAELLSKAKKMFIKKTDDKLDNKLDETDNTTKLDEVVNKDTNN